MPLQVAGAFHTAHMAPAVERARPARAGRHRRATRARRLLSNRDGAVVARRRATCCDGSSTRSATRCAGTSACATLAELGVTGLHRAPPGGHPRRAGQARAARRRDRRPQDPRRPAGSRGARREPRPWRDRMTEPTPHAERALRRALRQDRSPSAHTAPSGSCTTTSWSRRSTPPTSGSGSAPASSSRRWPAPDETRHRHGGEGRAGARPGGPRAADVDAVLVATVTHPYQTPSAAAMLAAPAGRDAGRGLRPLRRLRGLLLRRSAWRTTWSAAAPRDTCSSSASRSSPTSPTSTDRSTAFIFGDGAGAVVIGPSDEPAHRADDLGFGRLAVGRDRQTRRRGSSTARPRASSGRHCSMAGQTVFRWAVWQMAPVAQQALDAAGVDGRRARRLHPAPGEHADRRRRWPSSCKLPDTVAGRLRHRASPATPRPRRCRSRWTAARGGQAPHGGLALLIGFGAGLTYAAQVVRLP